MTKRRGLFCSHRRQDALGFIEDSLDHVFFNQPCMQLTCRSQRVHSSVFGKHRGTPRGSAIVPSSKTGTAHNLSILQPPRKGLNKEQVCWKGEHFPPSCRLFVSEWSLNTFKPVLVSSWCWVDIALELEDFQTTIGQASTNNSPNPRLSFGLSMKSATAACRATAPKKTIRWTASKSHLLQLATAHEGLSNTQICQNAGHLQFCWLPSGANEIWTHSRKSSFQYDCCSFPWPVQGHLKTLKDESKQPRPANGGTCPISTVFRLSKNSLYNWQLHTKVSATSKFTRMQGIFNSAGCHLAQTKFEHIQRSLLFNLTAAHHGQCKDIWAMFFLIV